MDVLPVPRRTQPDAHPLRAPHLQLRSSDASIFTVGYDAAMIWRCGYLWLDAQQWKEQCMAAVVAEAQRTSISARIASSVNRHRFSMLPPYASVRLLAPSTRNWLGR